VRVEYAFRWILERLGGLECRAILVVAELHAEVQKLLVRLSREEVLVLKEVVKFG